MAEFFETDARAKDIRTRLSADFTRVLREHNAHHPEATVKRRLGELSEHLTDEAMFYIEHLLLEIEGR